MTRMRRWGTAGIFLASALLGRAVDLDRLLFGHYEPDALVVTDVTPAGRKAPQPSSKQPVYYFYHPGGLKQMGEVVAGEVSPDQARVERVLVETLAKQGYLLATKKTPPPTILLSIWWGTLNPSTVDDPTNTDPASNDPEAAPVGPADNPDEPVEQRTLNSRQINMMTGAAKVTGGVWLRGDAAHLYEDKGLDRYFIFVAAYDLAAFVKHRKKEPLWFTRVSLPSNGTSLPDAVWTLIVSGGPFYGKDDGKVHFIDPEKIRRTEVKIGPTKYFDEDIPVPDPKAKSAPPPAKPDAHPAAPAGPKP